MFLQILFFKNFVFAILTKYSISWYLTSCLSGLRGLFLIPALVATNSKSISERLSVCPSTKLLQSETNSLITFPPIDGYKPAGLIAPSYLNVSRLEIQIKYLQSLVVGFQDLFNSKQFFFIFDDFWDFWTLPIKFKALIQQCCIVRLVVYLLDEHLPLNTDLKKSQGVFSLSFLARAFGGGRGIHFIFEKISFV